MPRYFFNVVAPLPDPDDDGSELSDIYAAQEAAVHLCGEMLKEIDGKFWEDPIWRLEVSGYDFRRLFTLTFSAEEHDIAA